MNNAEKHSGCTLLSVDFALHQITITDNGCGFDPSKRGTRNGITNMERRAKQIGMIFIVKSKKNNGTIITLCNMP